MDLTQRELLSWLCSEGDVLPHTSSNVSYQSQLALGVFSGYGVGELEVGNYSVRGHPASS